jgi:hypothetical protein
MHSFTSTNTRNNKIYTIISITLITTSLPHPARLSRQGHFQATHDGGGASLSFAFSRLMYIFGGCCLNPGWNEVPSPYRVASIAVLPLTYTHVAAREWRDSVVRDGPLFKPLVC